MPKGPIKNWYYGTIEFWDVQNMFGRITPRTLGRSVKFELANVECRKIKAGLPVRYTLDHTARSETTAKHVKDAVKEIRD